MYHYLFSRKCLRLAKHQLCLDSLGFRWPLHCTTPAASSESLKLASYLPGCASAIATSLSTPVLCQCQRLNILTLAREKEKGRSPSHQLATVLSVLWWDRSHTHEILGRLLGATKGNYGRVQKKHLFLQNPQISHPAWFIAVRWLMARWHFQNISIMTERSGVACPIVAQARGIWQACPHMLSGSSGTDRMHWFLCEAAACKRMGWLSWAGAFSLGLHSATCQYFVMQIFCEYSRSKTLCQTPQIVEQFGSKNRFQKWKFSLIYWEQRAINVLSSILNMSNVGEG